VSKKVFDVVGSDGEYKAQDGSTKTRWVNCGVVFKSDKGNYSMKLSAIPTRRNEEGELWLSLFVPQDKKPAQTASQEPQQGFRDNPAPAHDDDIPF
jgi:hypothetical protein